MLNQGHVAVCVVDDEEPVRLAPPHDVAVIDSYRLDRESERTYAKDGATVIVFDDLGNRPHAADILVDPTPRRSDDYYARLVLDGCRISMGPQHAMVRQAWRKLRRQTCARHAKDHPARRILLSMGSTDPINVSLKVIAAIAESGLDIETDVVLGQGAPHKLAVEGALIAGMSLHIDPPDFPERVAAADLVIGAPGSSSFERAVLGVPSILIPICRQSARPW